VNPPSRYVVAGNPVAHSQSPFIHAEFARQTGEALTYERLLSPLDAFAATVRGFAAGGGAGCNVTMPFKFEAFELAGERTPRATLARACNVLREFEAAADRQQRLAYEAAVIHAGLGDADAAFGRLQDAIASRSAWIAYLGVEPRLDPLRKDARYAQLESELELQDTAKAHAPRPREGP